MKKILLLILFIFLLSGCGRQKVTCKYVDNDLKYENERTLEIVFEDNAILKFKSNIIENHDDEREANNSYIYYQNLYDNYNENSVISSYKKDNLKITAIYNVDLRDIKNKKIEFEFDFTKNENDFLSELKEKGYKCK